MTVRNMFLSVVVALLPGHSAAKGLDDIQPTDKEAKAEDAANGDGQSGVKEPGKKPVPVNGTTAAKPQAKKAAQAPGPLSRALSEKLYLSASYGFARIPKAKIGAMSAQGMADITALWNFINEEAKNYKVMLTFRYAPIHSENEIEGQSYKSIIEGYHVGGQYRYRLLHKNLELVASGELGYLLVYQESRDKYPVQENAEKNELAYTLGTGFEWVLMDKISVGPRLYAGFGNIQVVQVSGSVTFTF